MKYLVSSSCIFTSDKIFVVNMQNEALHCENTEKLSMLEVQKEKSDTLERENKLLLLKFSELSEQKAEEARNKELEIEKLKRELEILRSQVSSLATSTVSISSSLQPATNEDTLSPNNKKNENIFDLI